MTTPAVIEKQNIDIKLTGGVNERDRPETIDWTRYLVTAENVVLDDYGALASRPGFNSTTNAGVSLYRTLPVENGVAFIAGPTSGFPGDLKLYQPDESTGTLLLKDRIPEFSVSSDMLSAFPDISSAVSDSSLKSIGLTTRYRVMLHNTTSISGEYYYYIIIADRYSNNIVKTYPWNAGAAGKMFMTVVSDRYLHFYVGNTAVNSYFFQIDTQSLPTDLTGISTTALAMTTADPVSVITVGSISVVLGPAGQVEKFNTSGASAGSATIAGFIGTYDLNHNGTDLFIIGSDPTDLLYMMKKVTTSSLATARTVTTTFAPTGKARISVSTTDDARIVSMNRSVSIIAGIYYPSLTVYSCGSAATDFTTVGIIGGYLEMSCPFYYSSTGRHYMALGKQLSGHTATPTVSRDTVAGQVLLVDITERFGTSDPFALRASAVLDGYINSVAQNDAEYGNSSHTIAVRPQISGNTIVTGLVSKPSAKSYGYEYITIKALDTSVMGGGPDVFSGGLTWFYDGTIASETGWLDTPSVFLADGGAGSVEAGLHNYVAVFEYKDAKGNSHFSRASRVSTINNAASRINSVQITMPGVFMHRRNGVAVNSGVSLNPIAVRVYRTVAGGTAYFLALTTQLTTTTVFTTTLSDNMTDVVLQTQPLMFRQPGSAGTALDRYSALSSTSVLRHKDRVFYSRGNNVYYSSFALDGEAVWFNPAFSFFVPGGSGNITALASIDGVLIVFKQDGIWVVDGDGPPENGGTGTEFSPPRRILTEFGCVDQRTITYTPNGIMYRSTRGIELLTRNTQVVWVGERVKDTCDANTENGGACFDIIEGRALFPISSTATNGLLTGVGATLCYDVGADAWTVWKQGIYPFQDLCVARAGLGGDTSNKYQVIGTSGGSTTVFGRVTTASGLDYGTDWVTWLLETGWIKGPSMQDRLKLSDLFILGKKLTNHNIVISVAYNYNDTYTVLKTFTPATINILNTEQLNINVPKQEVQSVKFKIETSAPSDTTAYPLSTGKQLDLLGISVRMGIKGQGAKLSTDAKG